MFTFLLMTLLYFLPAIVAVHRGHRPTGILILNFLLGWTGIGWGALLLWAILSTPPIYVWAASPYSAQVGWRRY